MLGDDGTEQRRRESDGSSVRLVGIFFGIFMAPCFAPIVECDSGRRHHPLAPTLTRMLQRHRGFFVASALKRFTKAPLYTP